MLNAASFHTSVQDPTPEGVRNVGRASTDYHGVEISATGQGIGIQLASKEHNNDTVFIEHYKGKWIIRVWTEESEDDPAHKIEL
jgi:hypothetical protein